METILSKERGKLQKYLDTYIGMCHKNFKNGTHVLVDYKNVTKKVVNSTVTNSISDEIKTSASSDLMSS